MTLEKLRETVRKSKEGHSFAPITAEIDAVVAGLIKDHPYAANEAIREDVEFQIEYVSVSPEYISELVGFFTDNPTALNTYLAEFEADSLEQSTKVTNSRSEDVETLFLKQSSW